MVSVQRGACYNYGRDGDYDCQECGRPETDAMRKRVEDFARPTCDECRTRLDHAGHHPDSEVSVGSVTISQGVGPDGKLRMQEHRTEKKIKYKDWDARCRKCVP